MGIAVVEGEVRFGQFELEQITGAGQVQGAGFGQRPSALFQKVGDIFATVGAVLVSVLEGADGCRGARNSTGALPPG